MNPTIGAKIDLAITILQNGMVLNWSDLQRKEYQRQVIALLEKTKEELTDIALIISSEVRGE